MIRRLGSESLVWRVREGDAAVGRPIKDLGLPREALVNLLVRDEGAIHPAARPRSRPVTSCTCSSASSSPEFEQITERWRSGPLGDPPVPALPPAARRRCSRSAVARDRRRPRPPRDDRGDPGPRSPAGAPRRRPARSPCSPTAASRSSSPKLLAIGRRDLLALWTARRLRAAGLSGAEVAWWQEVAGVIAAPPPRPAPALSGAWRRHPGHSVRRARGADLRLRCRRRRQAGGRPPPGRRCRRSPSRRRTATRPRRRPRRRSARRCHRRPRSRSPATARAAVPPSPVSRR